MLEVNNTNLKIEIAVLTKLINQYEEIKLNMFNQLKDACINWQDGNSLEFENQIYLENQEVDLILDSLNDKKEVLDFIYTQYSELGKTIKCNLNNRNTLVNLISNCQSQVNSILNDFNNLDRSFYYIEQEAIANQKNKILDTQTKLIEINNSITKNYNKIEEIENAIQEKINKLEKIKINDFDFNLG